MKEYEDYEYEVDLRDYIRVIWREKWIILAVFIVAIAAAIAISLNQPSQYRAETMLLITPRISEKLAEGGSKGSTMSGMLSPETYNSLATTNDLVKEIIDSFNLESSVESLKDKLNPQVKVGERYPLLTMTVRGTNPENIRNIANQWAALFINRNTKLLETETAQSYDFIKQRFEEVSKDLRAKEEEKKEYMKENPLEKLKSEVQVLRSKYSDFLSSLHSKRLELVEATTRLKTLQDELEDVPKFLELERSVSKEAIWEFLEGRITEERLKALPGLKVKEEEKNDLYFSLTNQLSSTRISLNTIQEEISHLEQKTEEISEIIDKKTSRIAEIELTLKQMDREISSLESTYNLLSDKLQEARIAKEESKSSIRIVEKAIAPQKATGPKRKMNVAVAGVLGLFVGVLLAFFKHYMQEGTTEEETEG